MPAEASNKKEKRYSQFRTKVLRILFFVGVSPLVIVSVVSLFTVVNTRLKNISELQAQVITVAEEKLNRYLEQKISVFNLVVDLDPDNLADISVDKLQFLAQGLKEAAEDINEIIFVDKYGKELVRESQVQGIETPVLKNINQDPGFQAAVKGENYFGPVYYTLSGPIMQVASQIESKSRKIIGVIVAEINLNPLESELGQMRLGEQGFVYLLDSQGGLMFSSDKSFANQGENLSYVPLVQDVISGKAHNGLSREDRYKNSLQQRVIFSGRPVGSVGWAIASEWPWGDAFTVIWVMLQRFLLIMAASLALIVLFSVFFSRLVVRPVEVLSRGADEISKGNFDYKVAIKTGDELEKLGERFENMKKVLKENQRLRDEFVFVAAHELRAPVTVIKGYLSMLLEGDYGQLTPEMKKILATTSNLNERLVHLVHDLLEVARSEAGRMEVELAPVSLSQAVSEILKEFEAMAKEKGINLIYQKPLSELKVMADGYKLKEVVTNLISNAIKYTFTPLEARPLTGQAQGKVEVSHEIQGNAVITHIKDQGMGISKENLVKLFSKFFRVKTKETKDVEGTGLGLFICKEIMERMNGKIWASSELGKGSCFSFSLEIAH